MQALRPHCTTTDADEIHIPDPLSHTSVAAVAFCDFPTTKHATVMRGAATIARDSHDHESEI
jgi:hypothetical protein